MKRIFTAVSILIIAISGYGCSSVQTGSQEWEHKVLIADWPENEIENLSDERLEFVKNFQKFYGGPAIIIHKETRNTYMLDSGGKMIKTK